MAFARPTPNANGELIRLRNTELSDVIRARNKREDRLLNVRLKFYERERNIRLNIIRKEQRQLERIATTLMEGTDRIQCEQQSPSAVPSWLRDRPKSMHQVSAPECIITDFQLDCNLIQTERLPVSATMTTADKLRCHSAR